jgi:hypothetical protein
MEVFCFTPGLRQKEKKSQLDSWAVGQKDQAKARSGERAI